MAKKIDHIVRVGEKNNFNQTAAEYKELQKHARPGRAFFVNSNAKTPIKARGLPVVLTINPELVRFIKPKGNLKDLAACRVKICASADPLVCKATREALEWCALNEVPVLLTFMRFRSKDSLGRFLCSKTDYVWNANYYRPNPGTQKDLIKLARGLVGELLHICDEKGTGCPACGNCARLTYGNASLPVHALNLSISGVEDKNGKQGICPFNCPDCWGKIVTYGKSPACDKVIRNEKQKGNVDHV